MRLQCSDVTEPTKFALFYRNVYKYADCDTAPGVILLEERYNATMDKKIECKHNATPGDHVEIEWCGEALEGMVDTGYIFTLPTPDNDDIFMSGIVHITAPCDDSEPQWIFLPKLVTMRNVKKVTITPRDYK